MRKIVIQLMISFISFFIVLNVNAQELNGWVHENGRTYYYENNQKVTGYKTIDNENYFFKESGVLQNNIVFLGNSETEIYDLNKYYGNYPAINSGVSGNTTRDVLNNIYNRVYKYNPSKVIILIGTNDIYFGINKAETISNINRIISNIKTNLPNTKIYLESIYPINNSDNPIIKHWLIGSRTNSFISSINDEIKDIEGVTYINVYDSLLSNELLNINYTYDGLHLNSNGYDIVTEILMPYVEEDDNSSNIKDKWYYKDSNTYYYENGELVKGYKTIDGIEYYFDNETGEKSIPVDSIELEKEITIEKEDTYSLKVNIFPSDAKNKKITWTSSNEEIATIDDNGVITAIKEGTTTITATSINNKTATCNVTVTKRLPKVKYKTHVQDYGWQDYVKNGEMSGTTGKAKRLEGIKIKLEDIPYDGDIEYKTHIENIGWEKEFKKNDDMSGTSGRALRLEAIEIKLTGDIENYFDIYYRVHAENFGWLGWARNGEKSGTAGYAYRLEGIEIKLIPKGELFSEYGEKYTFVDKSKGKTQPMGDNQKVAYTTHVENIGWQDYVTDGAMAGTSGRALRLEGIKIKVNNNLYQGDILYRTHIENIGWEKTFKKNDEMSGTKGRALRLEAIEIKLDGEISNHYDVYYRVHAENFGWLAWAKNGEKAGTAGYAYRLEGIEIILVDKGETPPERTNQNQNRSFIQR